MPAPRHGGAGRPRSLPVGPGSGRQQSYLRGGKEAVLKEETRKGVVGSYVSPVVLSQGWFSHQAGASVRL